VKVKRFVMTFRRDGSGWKVYPDDGIDALFSVMASTGEEED